MPIQFVIPLSLFILVSGWFIGAKNWESYTSATDIEKSLCSKTFKDGKNCPVIVLDPETSYSFSEIKQLVPAVVKDVTNQKKTEEDNKYQQANEAYNKKISQGKPATLPTVAKKEEEIKKAVLEKLESLTGSTGLKYEDLDPGKETTDLAIQKQWMTAIYNYQITNKVEYQKIIANPNNGSEDNKCNLPFGICLWPFGQNTTTSNGTDDVKSSNLYKKLKKDILAAMKPQQSTVNSQ